jgi:hypothetical protein
MLAEVLDLHRVKGNVFASDEHFADRCRCSVRKSRETIAELEATGYLTRDVNYARRHKRLLIPTEKWQNLPEVVADSATSSPEVVAESAGTSGRFCRELWQDLPGVVAESANINTIINTTLNTKTNTTTPFSRGDAAQEEESVLSVELEELVGEGIEPEVLTEAPAPKKKVAAKKKAPARAARPSRPEVPFLESELGSYEAFAAAFEGTDYELADLRYYHEKIKNWRQKGEPPLRKDWLATAKQFFLNDSHDNRLKLAPGVQRYDAASHGDAMGSGAQSTGYRSARHDR